MTRRIAPGASPQLDADRVSFVLVEPRSGGNVGSAARALKNLGFSGLVLVSPICDPRGPEARRLAVDAADVLDAAVVRPDLVTALASARMVVGTTARVGKHRRPHWRLEELAPRMAATAAGGELAVVFGREDRGLTDRELDLCTHLTYLPASREYPSFNLSQAVLLAAYELRRVAALPDPFEEEPPPAPGAEREALFRHLEQALFAIGFLKPDPAEVVMRRLRRLLGRAGINDEEVRLLRGVARQVLWAANRAGLAAAGETDDRSRRGPDDGDEEPRWTGDD